MTKQEIIAALNRLPDDKPVAFYVTTDKGRNAYTLRNITLSVKGRSMTFEG